MGSSAPLYGVAVLCVWFYCKTVSKNDKLKEMFLRCLVAGYNLFLSLSTLVRHQNSTNTWFTKNIIAIGCLTNEFFKVFQIKIGKKFQPIVDVIIFTHNENDK